MLTKQEMFDKVWDHFIVKRSKPGWDDGLQNCVYRASDGSRCAVGCLIPDEKYNADFDGIGDLADVLDAVWGPDFREAHYSFLRDLQRCHDNNAQYGNGDGDDFHTFFECSLRNIADEYDLKVPAN